MGADQSAVRSMAPGLEISSVIRAIRACQVRSLIEPRHITGPISWAPSKAYGLRNGQRAIRAIPSTSHERCRDPPTGVQSCHKHMLMQQDWGREPLLQALYANRLLGLGKKRGNSYSGWKTKWKVQMIWTFCGAWLQFALCALNCLFLRHIGETEASGHVFTLVNIFESQFLYRHTPFLGYKKILNILLLPKNNTHIILGHGVSHYMV